MRSADLLIVNARPWTDGALIRDADAVAIGDGRVLAIGRATALEGLAGAGARRIDARGGTVTPGLTDAHLHLVAWARALREARLDGLRTRRETVAAVAAAAPEIPSGQPVIGRGWASDDWEAPPHRDPLDALSPDRPVLLHSKDFHALWVNGAAMTQAGVRSDTPDPPGGIIVRDASGRPTGVFREHAVSLFDGLTPAASVATDLEPTRGAAERLLAMGVTEVQVFEGSAEAEVLRALAHGPGPRLRVLMHVPRVALERALESGLVSGSGDDWFRWGALKLFADGTLGSRTAALLEPYDATEEMGLSLIPPDEFKRMVGRAIRGGLSVAVHAIGDRAVRQALEVFHECGPSIERLALPPRIEHVQLIHEDDLARFSAWGVAASVQPAHATSDRPLAERAWRQRLNRAYPWRSLLDAGAHVAFGSDAPVELPSPARGIHAAVTREDPERPGDPFVAGQRISLDEALDAYTRGGARLAGVWPTRGSLRVGSVADLVVWSEDLHRASPGRLHEAAPAATLLDGEVVFERASRATVAAGGAR